jgi:iron complex transport system ATP-binding protein
MSAPLVMREAVARRGGFVLGPITLELEPGRALAVIGPNASGKSTLVALARGDLAASSGAVRLLGDDPSRLPQDEVARRAAVVRQGSAPRQSLSALELVLHGRHAHLSGLRLPRERDLATAREALRSVDAEGLAARDLRTLSGGELQRVLVARALAQEAPVLMLDEPTTSLDLGRRVEFRRLVAMLLSQDRALLLVTHDLDLAAGACDRVILLHEGRVLAAGAPAEVLTPELLEAAHGVAVEVDRHPATGRPRVTPRAS